MAVTKKDLNDERMAHAETKEKLDKALQAIEALREELKKKPEVITKEVFVKVPEERVVTKVVTKEVPVEVIRYVKVPDLSQVTKEELKKALKDDR